MAAKEYIEVAWSGGVKRLARRYPSRAKLYAVVANTHEIFYYRVITHLGTGKAAANHVPPRAAQILAVIFDRILPSESEAAVQAEYAALPESVRKWILGWWADRS
jgi:hypothetical protein